jgi:hypothetical protein
VLAAVTLAMFLPAMLVGCAVVARPVWVQIALVGPLCVLPIFVTARLLGSWLDTRRLHLGEILNGKLRERAKQRKRAKAEPAGNQKTRFPRRPESLEKFRAPAGKRIKVRRTATQQPASALQRPSVPDRPPAAPRRRPGTLGSRPPARAIEGRRPQARTTQPRTPPPPPQPAPPPDPRAELNEGPDLANIPGAYTVSGDERVRRGAAARPR